MSTSRRSFIKRALAALAGIFTLRGLFGSTPTPRKTLEQIKAENEREIVGYTPPDRRFYIDNIEVTVEKWHDYDNYPHRHCRSMKSEWFSMDNRMCRSSIGHPVGVNPEKWPDNLSTVRKLKPFYATPNA